MGLEKFRLDGKVALVTGGNRGIGLAIARLFVEAGAQCMISGRSRTADVDALLAAGQCDWVEGDLTDPDVPDRLVQATLDRFGRLDILVLIDIAKKYGKTPAQVVIRWDLQHGIVTIPKSVHEQRIIENADVFDFELSAADMAAIDALDRGERTGADPDNFNF